MRLPEWSLKSALLVPIRTEMISTPPSPEGARPPGPGERATPLRSEALHRTLTENLPDTSMYLFDRDLRVLIAGGEAGRGLEWLAEDKFQGRLLDELYDEIPAAVIDVLRVNLIAALAGERNEFELVTGGMTFFEQTVPVLGEDGTVESALLVARNVTERKLVERRLGENARQSAAVATLGQGALRERDLPLLIERVIATVAETLGVDQCAVSQLDPSGEKLTLIASVGFSSALDGHSISLVGTQTIAGSAIATRGPVVVEDLRTDTRFETRQVLRDEGALSGTCVVIEVGGEPYGVLGAFSVEPRRFGAEEVSFLVAVSNLMSAAIERQIQEAAHTAAYRLVENSSDVLARHSPDSTFLYVSPQCLQLWGFSPEELVGRSPFELLHPDDTGLASDALSGPDVQTITARMRHKDGSYVWVETTIRRLRDADGRICDIVSCAQHLDAQAVRAAARRTRPPPRGRRAPAGCRRTPRAGRAARARPEHAARSRRHHGQGDARRRSLRGAAAARRWNDF